MIISMIRENKNNYYINLEKKKDIYYYNVVCANNEETFYMNKEEISALFERIFKSNLTFLRKEEDYDVYLDEANNKRYLKDGKEDLLLFLKRNGRPAILYNGEQEEDDNYPEMKKYSLKANGKKYFMLATLSLSILVTLNIYKTFSSDYSQILLMEELQKYGLLKESEKITAEEIITNIMTTDDKNLSQEKRRYLANVNLINDVLEISDKSRNYILRRKTEGLNISYFPEEEKKEARLGYYSLKDINTLNLFDDSIYIFHYAAAHEFIHLLQDHNEYSYIREASAEIIKSEYYKERPEAYSEARKRLCILMEMIGPKPIMECNFKGDTSPFEDAIYKNLEKEDAEELLELFTKSPFYDEKSEEINIKIDTLLGKMYKNITGNDISNDELINYIYNNSTINRVYFNQNSLGFYEKFIKGEFENSEYILMSYESLKEYDGISKYIDIKSEDISEEEYKNIVPNENERVYSYYNPVEGYYYSPSDYQIISRDESEKYTLEEAISNKLIREVTYVKQKTTQYNSIDEFCNENHISSISKPLDMTVLFKSGEEGRILIDEDVVTITKLNFKTQITAPSIAKKFPDQVRKNNTTSNNNKISNELELMVAPQTSNNKVSVNVNSRGRK